MQIKQEILLDELAKDFTFENFQEYIHNIMNIRGFNNQNPQDKLMLLIEEIGELAKAIRKTNRKLGIDYERVNNYDTIESEVADTIIVLFSMCDLLNLNVKQCILNKERLNVKRTWK